jgi:hypothetical protein
LLPSTEDRRRAAPLVPSAIDFLRVAAGEKLRARRAAAAPTRCFLERRRAAASSALAAASAHRAAFSGSSLAAEAK